MMVGAGLFTVFKHPRPQQQQHESDFWRRRPADSSMNKYEQQQQHESDFWRRRPADEGRGTKMRKHKEKTDNNGSSTISNSPSFDLRNDRIGTISNSTAFSLRKEPQPHRGIGPESGSGGIGGGSRGRSPRPGFDPLTDENLLYKTSVGSPNLRPRRPVDEKKPVNWRLACFISNEYLTRGTLLGRPWPPQDFNPKCCHENNYKSKAKPVSLDQDEDEIRREKERLYYTVVDFLRAGDVHLPGIVNPSQLASWLELNS